MGKYSYKLCDSYFVELEVLNQKLAELSNGVHQWMAVPVPGTFIMPEEQPRSCVLVGYSNPDGTSLPNHLCYLFPMAALAGYPESDPKLIVQLEPGWMPALSRGLYCEDGSIKIDPMEDFFRVWIPLKRSLGLLDNPTEAGMQDLNYVTRADHAVSLEDEETTRETLHKHLIWHSECTEIIQDAVSEDVDATEFFERLSEVFRRRRPREREED